MKLLLIQAPMSVTIMQNSLESSVAGERHLGFPSRYVGVLFAYFDYLLESFGFKTCKFGGSHGSKITSSKPVVFSLFVLVLFRLYFFSGD